MSTRWIAIFLSFAIQVSPAHSQRLPSKLELKTLYCAPMLRRDLQVLASIEELARSRYEEIANEPGYSEQEKQERMATLQSIQRRAQDIQNTQNRLQSYLMPRAGEIDFAAMEAAISRGESDAQLMSTRSKECTEKRPIFASPEYSDKCMGMDLLNRARDCRSASWLPF